MVRTAAEGETDWKDYRHRNLERTGGEHKHNLFPVLQKFGFPVKNADSQWKCRSPLEMQIPSGNTDPQWKCRSPVKYKKALKNFKFLFNL